MCAVVPGNLTVLHLRFMHAILGRMHLVTPSLASNVLEKRNLKWAYRYDYCAKHDAIFHPLWHIMMSSCQLPRFFKSAVTERSSAHIPGRRTESRTIPICQTLSQRRLSEVC